MHAAQAAAEGARGGVLLILVVDLLHEGGHQGLAPDGSPPAGSASGRHDYLRTASVRRDLANWPLGLALLALARTSTVRLPVFESTT